MIFYGQPLQRHAPPPGAEGVAANAAIHEIAEARHGEPAQIQFPCAIRHISNLKPSRRGDAPAKHIDRQNKTVQVVCIFSVYSFPHIDRHVVVGVFMDVVLQRPQPKLSRHTDICDSLKYEDEDKRRSFWIHGAYGTGKSYAGIVLKHLFEDDISSIRRFLSNQMLIQYRDRFLSIREKGEFLVIWKSQATDIRSGIQLMMTMEDAIRKKLKEKYGQSAYYGKNSLIAAAQEAVNDSSINWEELFVNPAYGLFEEYGSVDEFRDEVLNGSLKAANVVARIYRDKGWGFFTSLTKFKEWVADVIEGNHLQDTGIIFIWDEFTSYLRNNPTDDVLQPLSEFCKEQPFFMFLIVHRAPSWVSQIGEEIYEQIIHRYHSLDFHVSESAAYELIGSSILTRAGMDEQWNAERDKLMKSISKNFADFDNLDMSNKKERLRQLCPLHPMTLSLLAIVAQNFGASQRTLFRFMKDPKESEQNVGFI